jgi:hypothetical protein
MMGLDCYAPPSFEEASQIQGCGLVVTHEPRRPEDEDAKGKIRVARYSTTEGNCNLM